ncbi:MAG: hypothetical protein JWL72_4792 [Ilumatobacteraceae bacterium]|nr:hypothetical protein [Ilumatobacteraceae bacterium]MCU1391454.1 hypothetical protein [Ilumatobacteraceae bacterium]
MHTARRSAGSWRLAVRLARREVRRRWGRTAIVVALVALPVAGLAAGDMLYRSNRGESDNRGALGAAAARLDFGFIANGPIDQDFATSVAPTLPAGTKSLWLHESGLLLRRSGSGEGPVNVNVSDVDLDNPLTAGMVRSISGRAPRAADEVLLSTSAAHDFGVSIGDTLTLVKPPQSFTVVGLAVRPAVGDPIDFVTPGFDFSVLRDGYVRSAVLLGGQAWIEHPQLAAAAVADAAHLQSGSDPGFDPNGDTNLVNLTVPMSFVTPVPAGDLAVAWLYGVLAMSVLGVIVSAAFAVSGPRQLVTVGQLSAQGANAAMVRRFLALQGSVSGAGGALIGLAVGRLTYRATVRLRYVGSDAVSVRDLIVIGATAVVVSTVAALVPSRSLARISVLAALGGRRPVGGVPRPLLPSGLLLVAVGLAGMVVSVASPAHTASTLVVASLAAMMTLAGVCCLCPPIIVRVATLVSRRRGSARLAARSLVRHRARSSALLAAIVAVGAAGTALATYGEHQAALDRRTSPGLPANVVDMASYPTSTLDGRAAVDSSIDPELADPLLRAHVEGILGTVRWIPTERALDAVAYVAGNFAGQIGGTASTDALVDQPFRLVNAVDGLTIDTTALVASDDVLGLLGVDAAGRAALMQRGALLLYTGNRRTLPMVGDGGGTPVLDGVEPAIVLHGGDPITIPMSRQTAHLFASNYFLVTTDLASSLGLDIVGGDTYAVAAEPITIRQRDALDGSDLMVRSREAQQFRDVALVPRALAYDTPWIREGSNSGLYRVGVSVGALFLVLLVISFGLALWAAEGRDEQQMLRSVGASPRALAEFTTWRALILTSTGMVMAVPLGYGAAWLIATTSIRSSDAPFPWIVAGALLVGVPIVVSGISLTASSIAHRRPPR